MFLSSYLCEFVFGDCKLWRRQYEIGYIDSAFKVLNKAVCRINETGWKSPPA